MNVACLYDLLKFLHMFITAVFESLCCLKLQTEFFLQALASSLTQIKAVRYEVLQTTNSVFLLCVWHLGHELFGVQFEILFHLTL